MAKVPNASVTVSSKNVALRALVNDVPIHVDTKAEGTRTNALVNHWTKPGKNTVELRLSWPNEKPFVAGQAEALLEARIGEAGEAINEKDPEVELKWPKDDEPEQYPQRIRDEFEHDELPETRLWHETVRLHSISDRERDEIIAEVEHLYQLYVTKNVDAIQKKIEIKTLEIAAAYGDDPDDRLKKSRSFTEKLVGTPGWGLEEFKPDEIEMEIVGRGHLLWVYRSGFRAPFKSVPAGGFIWHSELYFAKLQSNWTIIR